MHEIWLGGKENTPGFVHPSGHSTISEAIKLESEVKTKKLFFVHSSRQTANQAVVLANQRVAGLEAINPIIGEKYRID
jgi:ribonuclease BN (tRNA processing enzyme)